MAGFLHDSWNNLRPNQVLCLSPVDGDRKRTEEEVFLASEMLRVTSAGELLTEDNDCRRLLFDAHTTDKEEFLVVVKPSPEGGTTWLYKNLVKPGSRTKIIEEWGQWVFEEPTNVDSYDISELDYAREVEYVQNPEPNLMFRMKDPGEVEAVYAFTVGDLHRQERVVFYAEYDCEETPMGVASLGEGMIIEVGGLWTTGETIKSSQEFVRFMVGQRVVPRTLVWPV